MEAFDRHHALWSAVVGLAVRDAAGDDMELRREAREWLFASEDFEHIVGLLGLEPDWVRRVVRQRLGIRPRRRLVDVAPRGRYFGK